MNPEADLPSENQEKQDSAIEHPSMLVFDREKLKDAVVSGASLLRMMSDTNLMAVDVDFDDELIDRLPYSIGFDEGKVSHRTLFREHQKYSQLGTQEVDAPETSEDEDVVDDKQEVNLQRRWPGATGKNGGWEKFLQFRFKEPVDGKVLVSYSDEPEFASTLGFRVYHEPTDQYANGRVVAHYAAGSPLERGDL